MRSLKKSLVQSFLLAFFLIVGFLVFLVTPWGRPLGKALILLPEVVPNFPIRPLKFISKNPNIEEVTIKTVEQKEAKADLYRPADNKKHPAVVFTLGTMVTRKDTNVTRFAQALSRLGFVVLVPDLPDFISGFVWTDSVERLVSSIEFLDKQVFVDNKKIGFAGFCVGASASIIAAENENISDKVAFISAVSPYFDLFSLSEATTTRLAEDGKGGWEVWEPHPLTVQSVQKGFINYLPDAQERQLLTGLFLEQKGIKKEQIEDLSVKAFYVYSFLSNSDKAKMSQLWQQLPDDGRKLLSTLSPSSRIGQLKAKLFVLNDKKDTYVPKIEGEKLARSLPKNQVHFVAVDSFEHVNPKTKLKRLAAIKGFWQLGNYLYRIFAYIG